jgi:hypothetical protein
VSQIPAKVCVIMSTEMPSRLISPVRRLAASPITPDSASCSYVCWPPGTRVKKPLRRFSAVLSTTAPVKGPARG